MAENIKWNPSVSEEEYEKIIKSLEQASADKIKKDTMQQGETPVNLTENNQLIDEIINRMIEKKKNDISLQLANISNDIKKRIGEENRNIIINAIDWDTFIDGGKIKKLTDGTKGYIFEKNKIIILPNTEVAKSLHGVLDQIWNEYDKETTSLNKMSQDLNKVETLEKLRSDYQGILSKYETSLGFDNIKLDGQAKEVIFNIDSFKANDDGVLVGTIDNKQVVIEKDNELYNSSMIAMSDLAYTDLVLNNFNFENEIIYKTPSSLKEKDTPITVTGEKAIKVAAEDVNNLSSDNEIEPISEIPPLVSLEEKRESEILGDKLGIKELSKYDSIESIKDDIYNILKDFPCDYNKKLDLIKCNTLNFPRKEQTKLRNHIFDVENEKGKLKVYKKTVIKVCSISRTLLGTPLYTVGQVFKWIKNPINRAGIPYLESTEKFFKKYYKKWKLKRGMKLLKRPEIIGKDKNKETKVNSENKEPEIKPENKETKVNSENKEPEIKPENKETKVNSENKEPEIKPENQQKPADKKYINLLDNTCRVLEQDNLDDNKKIDMEGLKKSLDKFGISMNSYKEFSARRQQKSITNYINEKHIKAFTDDLHEKTEKNREKVIAETNKKIAEEFKAAEELKRLEMMKNSLNSVKSPNIGMNPYLREEIMAAKKTHVAPLETNNNQLPTNFKSELDQLFEQPVEEKGKSK